MKRAVQKLGVFAFLFFLVKGLLWLAIPAGIGIWAAMAGEKPAPAATTLAPTGTGANDDSQ